MRRIAVLVGGLLVLSAIPAAAAPPDKRIRGDCSFVQPGEARSHLELTDIGVRIRVRFEVHGSPPGHEWAIRLRRHKPTIAYPFLGPDGDLFFQGTRVASDRGDFVVRRFRRDVEGDEGYLAKAVDTQTGQVCRARAWF